MKNKKLFRAGAVLALLLVLPAWRCQPKPTFNGDTVNTIEPWQGDTSDWTYHR